MITNNFGFFGLGLEEAFGFPVTLIEEIGEGSVFWRVVTPHGEACLKRFRAVGEVANATRASLFLHDSGFAHTPKVIPTVDGRPYVRSPMTDPVWYLALFEWVEGSDSDPAPTLGEWLGEAPRGSDEYREIAAQMGRFLGRFHEAARGYLPWPVDRDAAFWVWSFQRIRHQVRLARSRVAVEERPEIKQLVETALENCEPVLEEVIGRAEQSVHLFQVVLGGCRDRNDVRHCDLHLGNFLIGADGLMIIDLAELEPGPRIKEAYGLWQFDDESNALAVQAYCEEVQVTKAEVELFPVINDRIEGWRRFLDGYLSGDWTDEMMLNYHWHVDGDYREKREHLLASAEILQEISTRVG